MMPPGTSLLTKFAAKSFSSPNGQLRQIERWRVMAGLADDWLEDRRARAWKVLSRTGDQVGLMLSIVQIEDVLSLAHSSLTASARCHDQGHRSTPCVFTKIAAAIPPAPWHNWHSASPEIGITYRATQPRLPDMRLDPDQRIRILPAESSERGDWHTGRLEQIHLRRVTEGKLVKNGSVPRCSWNGCAS